MDAINPDYLFIDTEIDRRHVLRPVDFLWLVMAMRHSSIVLDKLDASNARSFLPATVIGSDHPHTCRIVELYCLTLSVVLSWHLEDGGWEAIGQMHLHWGETRVPEFGLEDKRLESDVCVSWHVGKHFRGRPLKVDHVIRRCGAEKLKSLESDARLDYLVRFLKHWGIVLLMVLLLGKDWVEMVLRFADEVIDLTEELVMVVPGTLKLWSDQDLVFLE